jgi:hypothetical protein
MLINKETRDLLKSRWDALPISLKLANQVVGKFWVQCSYTLGPSYCSFGCSHCYLPSNANRVPLVPLVDMKAQIDANRRMQGKGGAIQVTGGDVVDAYVRAGKEDELVEVVAYCVKKDLVPMLMTHGQGLLDNPDLLARLVNEAGLRKISCHIDITQAGRPGFPVRELKTEAQLNPLRDDLVDLVMQTRRRTGKNLVAAQTVTVGTKNLAGIGEILHWLISRPQNMDVTRTISFQTEAEVGRTLGNEIRVSPEEVWSAICKAVNIDLPRDHLLFGHPDCTSTATIVARSKDQKMVYFGSRDTVSKDCWQSLLEKFGGLNLDGNRPYLNKFRKALILVRYPGLLMKMIRYARTLWMEEGLTLGMMASLVTGQAKGFNIVMHNFMGASQAADRNDPVVRDRLEACSFRGAVQKEGEKEGHVDGEWVAVSMCEMNASIRPQLYQQKVARKVSRKVSSEKLVHDKSS